MGWTDWFFDSNGDGAAFKGGQDGKDGSFRSERLSGSEDSNTHFHDIAKTSTDGQHKEIYTESRTDSGLKK